MNVSTIVQSINDVSDKMSVNATNIENLTTISDEVESKINLTSNAMSTSNHVASKSHDDSLTMSKTLKEVIDAIKDIEALSTANGTSALSIEEDLKKLVEVASSLQNTINEFKS